MTITMLPLFRRVIALSSLKRFYVCSCKIFPSNGKSDRFCPVNSYCVAVFSKVIFPERINILPCNFTTDVRLEHQENKSEVLDCIRRFENVLARIEKENELTVDQIRFYVDEMIASLEDGSFQSDSRKTLLVKPGMVKLLECVHKSMDQLAVNDLMSAARLCSTLPMSPNFNIYFEILKKLQENFRNVNFSEKVTLYELFRKSPFESMRNYAADAENEIEKEIKQNLHLNSSKDIANALAFVCLHTFAHEELRKEVMSAVLDLKIWDHKHIYTFFWIPNKILDSSIQNDLNEKYLKRIKEELNTSNCRFLHHFLANYSLMVNSNKVVYDKNLVDDIVNKYLKTKLKIQEIRSLRSSLSMLRHSHYGFVEYLINFLRRNAEVFKSHPDLSADIVRYIADCNCNSEELDRWSMVQPILRENPNLNFATKFSRSNIEQYLHFLTQLMSLEIFIDQDLKFLSGFLYNKIYNRRNSKTDRIMKRLNESARILYPSFSYSHLTSSQDVSTKFKNFIERSPNPYFEERLHLLKDIGKQLGPVSGTGNYILPICFKKSGYFYDALVAVNSNGEFYDFGTQPEERKMIFVEDVSVPTDFKLVSLLLVSEKECSRNTFDLEGASVLRLKIQEASGYPTAVIYTHLLNTLSDDEKRNYLCEKIFKKISLQKITNDCSREKKIVEM